VTGERKRFASAILPAWARKSPRVAEVLPLLYLHGLAVQPRLRPGAGAVPRHRPRPLASHDHPPDQGLAGRGRRVRQALAEGHRLRLRVGRRDPPQGPPGAGQGVPAGHDRRPCRRHQGADRARRRPPRELRRIVGRPAPLGQAARDAGPGARGRGRCAGVLEGAARGVPRHPGAAVLVAQIGNVLAALPKSVHKDAKAALAETYNAEDREHAQAAARASEATYGAKWPKAVAKITEDLDVLLAFYDYPAEHWVHLRTTNPIESTLRHRPPSTADHQGTRLAGRRRGDGVQAHRVRPTPLASRQRTPPRRPRPRRRTLSRRASWSNVPTSTIRRRSASRMTRRSTGLDYSSPARTAVARRRERRRCPVRNGTVRGPSLDQGNLSPTPASASTTRLRPGCSPNAPSPSSPVQPDANLRRRHPLPHRGAVDSVRTNHIHSSYAACVGHSASSVLGSWQERRAESQLTGTT
jgi:hypothetical protein